MSRKQLILSNVEEQLLNFIIPNQHPIEVLLDNTPNSHIVQNFITVPKNPRAVWMSEKTEIDQNRSTILFLFEVDGRELKVIVCGEEAANENTAHYNTGYPYIRLPHPDETFATWQYNFCENITVKCRAQLLSSHAKNNLQILRVERVYEYQDGALKHKNKSTEEYVAGFGLQRRIKTKNYKQVTI